MGRDDRIAVLSTRDIAYRDRLVTKSGAWWKRLIPVQAPYRFNVRRLCQGKTLEIGCGIGRNLSHLGVDRAIGVDHNVDSVATAKSRGLIAFAPEEFVDSRVAKLKSFDHLLFAHVAEHMTTAEFKNLVNVYTPYLKDDGTIVCFTPQERGYASDATHVRFVDFGQITHDLLALGFTPSTQFSFPFPRAAGRLFPHNEFVVVARRYDSKAMK